MTQAGTASGAERAGEEGAGQGKAVRGQDKNLEGGRGARIWSMGTTGRLTALPPSLH